MFPARMVTSSKQQAASSKQQAASRNNALVASESQALVAFGWSRQAAPVRKGSSTDNWNSLRVQDRKIANCAAWNLSRRHNFTQFSKISVKRLCACCSGTTTQGHTEATEGTRGGPKNSRTLNRSCCFEDDYLHNAGSKSRSYPSESGRFQRMETPRSWRRWRMLNMRRS